MARDEPPSKGDEKNIYLQLELCYGNPTRLPSRKTSVWVASDQNPIIEKRQALSHAKLGG
jgi:hypothetical protein